MTKRFSVSTSTDIMLTHIFRKESVSPIFLTLILLSVLTILLWLRPVGLRCSSGLGVPCRRKGHGSSGGAGVRSGPDHSHHPYLFLPHLGHSLTGHGASVTVTSSWCKRWLETQGLDLWRLDVDWVLEVNGLAALWLALQATERKGVLGCPVNQVIQVSVDPKMHLFGGCPHMTALTTYRDQIMECKVTGRLAPEDQREVYAIHRPHLPRPVHWIYLTISTCVMFPFSVDTLYLQYVLFKSP